MDEKRPPEPVDILGNPETLAAPACRPPCPGGPDPARPPIPKTTGIGPALRDHWPLILVVLLLAVVYAPVARYPFITFDDPAYITDNPMVKRGVTPEGLSWAFTAAHASFWHPVTWLSHQLDCQLFGLNAGAHHLVNVAFHIANALLFYAFLFLSTRRRWPSVLCAALFALHPLRVESVAWAAERKDVLSAFFLLLTLLAWRRYVQRPSLCRMLPALLCCAAGLLSKPMLVTLPFLLLLLDFWPFGRLGGATTKTSGNEGAAGQPGRRFWRLLGEKVPFFVLAGVIALVTVRTTSGAMPVEGILSFPVRLANAVQSVWSYLLATVWPVGLSVLYPYVQPGDAGLIGAAFLVLLAATLALWRAARRNPAALVGWLWFLGTLVPVLGLIQVGTQSRADRFTYIPHLGLMLAAVWLVSGFTDRFPAGRGLAAVAAGAVVGTLTLLSAAQVRCWKDSETLYAHSLQAAPGSHLLHGNLGNVYLEQGRCAEAKAQYEQALRLNPRHANAWASMGILLLRQGRPAEALAWLERATREDRRLAVAFSQKGVALVLLGSFDAAAAAFTQALSLKPEDPDTLCNLAAVRVRQGRPAEAGELYRRALEFAPDRAQAHTALGMLRFSAGDTPGALSHLRAAVQLDPENADARFSLGQALLMAGRPGEAKEQLQAGLLRSPNYAPAWYNLGLLALAEGDAGGAAAALERAVALNPGQAAAHNALGTAYLAQGRNRDAATCFRETLRLDPTHEKARRNLDRLPKYSAAAGRGTVP